MRTAVDVQKFATKHKESQKRERSANYGNVYRPFDEGDNMTWKPGSARPYREIDSEEPNMKKPGAGVIQRDNMTQRKTKIQYTPSLYYYNYDEEKEQFANHVTVGWRMHAILNPHDPKIGSTTNAGGNVHSHLQTCLKEKWKTDIFRGHLLNAHLGGLSIEENLFPISRNANQHHLYAIEKYVKGYVYDNARPANIERVEYAVNVCNLGSGNESEGFNESNPRTCFECKVDVYNTENTLIKNVQYRVESDLRNNGTNDKQEQKGFSENDSHCNNAGGWGVGTNQYLKRVEQGQTYKVLRGNDEIATVLMQGQQYVSSV